MRCLIVILFFFSIKVYSQNCDFILYSEREPVEFATIQSLHSSAGATSDQYGRVKIKLQSTSDTLVIRALGFSAKEVPYKDLTDTIKLEQVEYDLAEVVIIAPAAKDISVERSRPKKSWYIRFSNSAWIVFRKINSPTDGCLLNSISLFSKAQRDDLKLYVYLQQVGADGMPSNAIYSSGKEVLIPKGKRQVEIDFSDLALTIEANGVFVAFTAPVDHENSWEDQYKDENNVKRKAQYFGPSLRMTPIGDLNDGFVLSKGKYRWLGKIDSKNDVLRGVAIDYTLRCK